MNTLLELRNIRQAYGRQTVVNDLSLMLKKGDIGCLLGPERLRQDNRVALYRRV